MPKAPAWAPQPGNEKGRRAGRPSRNLNILNNSVSTDTYAALRLQRLFGVGLAGTRADLVACLAWGEPQ